MRAMLLIAFLFGLPMQALAQGVLSPEQFRDSAAAAVRQVEPGADIEVDGPLKLGILLPDGRGMSVPLDELYQVYLADPSSGASLATQWARMVVSRDLQGDEARDRIVALVRSRDMEPASDNLAFTQFIIRPFIGDLVELLVIDGSESFSLVTRSRLAELGVSAEEAWRLSRINIRQRIGQARVEPFAVGIIAISATHGLGPSALTDPAICQSADAEQRRFLVVDEETVLVADSRQGVDMPTLRDRLVQADATASRTILTCRQGQLIDYDGV
jgi:hypothetical protein